MTRVRLLAVGDISLQTRDNENPFRKVQQAFASKEVLFGNLETVLSNHGKAAEKAVVLYTSPNKASHLKEAGFDVLNVANNHIMDLGPEGCNETLEVLNQNGLNFIGASNHKFIQPWAIIENKGLRLGFLGYSQGGFSDYQASICINRIDKRKIIRDINDVKSQCDVIIISLHWGLDNVPYPSPKQIALAHKLVDAGATIVLGHHPHVIQGIERYKSGLIAYSLGNFQFDRAVSQTKSNRSLILSVELGPTGLENYSIIPVEIGDDFAPKVSREVEAELLTFIEEKTSPITKGIVTEEWWFEQIARAYLSGNMKSWIIRIKKYGLKHLLKCIRWVVCPFCIKCYIGIIRRNLRKHLGPKQGISM